MALNNYVKFMRGSLAAYEALTTKNEDTLYFIKISEDETRLYWGDRLISDGNEMPTEIVTALKDLTDVNIAEGIVLTDGMFLGYNTETGKWEPKTQTEVTVEDMVGATSETAGSAGLVPAPAAGDEKKVLTGDGNWTELSIPDTSDLETKMATLIGSDENLSIRDIAANELATQLIPENAAESLNELKEIATWIQEHPEDASAMNLAIQDLENAVFDKTPRIDEEGNPVLDETTGEQIIDKVSKIGNLEEDLKEAQEEIVFITTEVGQLETLLGAQKDDNGALTGLTAVDKINVVVDALEPKYDEDGAIISFKEIDKISDLEQALGAEYNEDGTLSSLATVDKITVIETALGLEKDEDSGSIVITAAPIGKLEDLLLVKNAQEGEETPANLVEAINMLTDQMTWGELPE